MKQRIDEILTGTYKVSAPRLIVSPDRIDESVSADDIFRGELNIGTSDGSPVRGQVLAGSTRVVFETDVFSGGAALPFAVNLKGIKAGESLSAVITVVTSLGETDVPLHIEVEEEASEVPYPVKYLDDFTAIAREDSSEAFRLFSDRRFERLLTGGEAAWRGLYRALSQNPLTYQRMEEFLVAAGKKDPVRITCGEEERGFYHLRETTKEELRLTKNTWGCLSLHVEVEGDFLEVPKKHITEEDFVGSVCDLDYVVHAEKVNGTRRYGRITLRSAYQTLVFKVTASRGGEVRIDLKTAAKKSLSRLMRDYLDFRMNRTDARSWANRSLTTLTAMREMGGYPVWMTLYEAYLCFMSGDQGSARRLLRSLQEHDFTNDSLEVKGAFLYLCHICELLTPGRIDVVARIRDWQRRDQDSFVLLFLLMQIDEDLNRTPLKKMLYMEELYDRGCMSPLLYAEALSLLRLNGDLLRRLTGFTRQVLSFAVRQNALTRELAQRAFALSENEKSFSRKMYRILEKGYELSPTRDGLEAVCRLIIKGEPRRPEYFRWYALAVDENIRLTRLYEYYVETLPPTYRKSLPSPVRKYFLMSHSVGGRDLARIYANVIRNRAADEATYRDYVKTMATFTAQALMDGAINEDYAVLYSEAYPTVSDRVVGEALSGVMFTVRLFCDDPRVRDVVVQHDALSHEAVTPLKSGVSYINVYSSDARILFQDEKGRRYATGVSYSLEPLMETEALTKDLRDIRVTSTGLLCHICGGDPKKMTVTPETVGALIMISDSEDFTGRARRDARKKILSYMTDNPLSDSLTPYLREINIGRFARTDKALLLDVLVTRGLYDAAYDVIRRYGCEKANTTLLMKLVSRRIEEEEASGEIFGDDLLMTLAAYVYRCGKYDEKTLDYLIKGYDGPMRDMEAVRESAEAFYLETFPIDERLIKRAVFVRRPLKNASEILKNYRRMGGSTDVLMAYVGFDAAGYLMGQREIEPYVSMVLTEACGKKEPTTLPMRLACLKALSQKEELTLGEENVAEDLLEEMNGRGIRLAFFRNLPDRCLTGYHLKDRLFVEQMADPADKVTLFYKLTNGPAREGDDWIREPLPQVTDGVFVREFVLFYGETLTYYITIEHEGEITQTPERTKTMPSVDMTGRSRYQLLNQMLSAHRLGRTDLFLEKEKEFRRATHRAETLFDLTD